MSSFRSFYAALLLIGMAAPVEAQTVQPAIVGTVSSTPVNGTTATANTFQSVLSAGGRNGCLIENTSAQTEYFYFGPIASATEAASIQLAPGASISCWEGNVILLDQISVASVSAGATFSGFVQ